MKASDDFQWMLIASLSPSCALPLPLPLDALDDAPDQTVTPHRTHAEQPSLSHRLALGAGVVLAVLPVLVTALA
ncbi:hypothetical protein [Azospirillum brasilense]|uniref:Uncharacterized protein n=1 Tax=Azospirillum brasilense TaxID=192 RepID=A0A235HDK8_AZOBR|nr:hypothetical protein [Azospirillum brasilense]OYD83838.1 hypothetical protein CHT98_13720 [Azospirillum brasilense]